MSRAIFDEPAAQGLGERIAIFQESAALANRLDPADLTPDQLEEVSQLFKEAVTGRARIIDELQGTTRRAD